MEGFRGRSGSDIDETSTMNRRDERKIMCVVSDSVMFEWGPSLAEVVCIDVTLLLLVRAGPSGPCNVE